MAGKRILQGNVVSYDAERGLGEIVTESGEAFSVHRSELRDEATRGIYAGDIVEFVAGRDRFGRKAAQEVHRVGWVEDEGDDETPREWTF